MAEVYVYAPDCDDFSTLGECGALLPTVCRFEEVANGLSQITLEHPVDPAGKFACLQAGYIIKAEVPVRTTPEIISGQYVTHVETWTVKTTATKAQRYIYTKASGGKKRRLLGVGTTVVVTYQPAEGARWKVKSGRYAGWMESVALEQGVEITVPDTAEGIETVAPAWECREQLFRINDVSVADDGVTCTAQHISYDLLYNLTVYDATEAVTLQQALDGVLGNCLGKHAFDAQTDISGTHVGAHYIDVDPITAMLDPESGLAAAWSAQLVRDDYELYFLGSAGLDRGLRIEYAKNLLGVEMTVNSTDVATHIRPVGEQKDGKPLYLEEKLVTGPLAENYPFARIHKLNCTDCKVGTNGVTATIAYARMREQAEALFAQGVDRPSVGVKVEFINLGDTERYAQYRGLENVYLYDTVTVYHPKLRIDITTNVTHITWDCLARRMEAVELGSLQALIPSVASWQIPSGISGGKLLAGSVGSGQMGDDIISARHLQAESVNTEALQAEAVTAEKVKAGSLDAMIISAVTGTFNDIATGRLTASEAYIAFADMMALAVGQITAGTITTDQLAAALGTFVALWGDTAGFDFASIRDMVTDEAIIRAGTAGELYIDRLAVTSAVMVSATLGELVVKGGDGAYYQITVQADGTLGTSAVSVSADEAAAGQTTTGKKIVETEMDVAALSAQTVKAANAQIGTILTSALTAGKITAGEALIASATIPTLYVTAVEAIGNSMTFSANATIRLLLGAVDTVNRWFTFDNERGLVIQKPAWTDADGVEHAASIWYTVTDEVGYHIRRTDMAGPVGSFARDRLIVDGVQVGEIVCRKTSGGAWVWTDA